MPLCDAPQGRGGTWNQDGVIVLAPSSDGPLFKVPAAGGAPVQVTELDKGRSDAAHRHPKFLPDGKHFVFFVAVDGSPLRSPDGNRWSRDGQYILYTEAQAKPSLDVWVLPLSGEKKPVPFLQSSLNENRARFFPVGRIFRTRRKVISDLRLPIYDCHLFRSTMIKS